MRIEHTQVIPMLLNACPSFKETWERYSDINKPQMFKKNKVIAQLLKTCPWFKETWERYSDADQTQIYSCFSEFARHLLSLYKKGETDEFSVVAEAIEKLHVYGTPYVKEAATIGLLEGIQNTWYSNNINPDQFIQFLKPESARWWEHLDDFWQRNTATANGQI